MCLIALSWDPAGPRRLLVLANRDEFYARPTRPADWWDDHPDVWGGRDLSAGGTWLGITRGGRFAAITNYREPGRHDPRAQSRGHLVLDFLAGDMPAAGYLQELGARAGRFNGFNLLVGEMAGPSAVLGYLSHRAGQAAHEPAMLPAGLYGLSNAVLDTPWPKVLRTIAGLSAIDGDADALSACFELLSDRRIAADAELPSTGVSLERERMLSAPFIVSPDYGTRAQTVLRITRDGIVDALERSYDDAAQAGSLRPAAERQVRFALANTASR
ncbi:NRDE family protein [Pigmentiphaga soli]|uniref:NRDE family protein n=1 Tax=Pigmentiphaga soli TaxID=1007095 RepID=A0ABP8H8L1_9BURK